MPARSLMNAPDAELFFGQSRAIAASSVRMAPCRARQFRPSVREDRNSILLGRLKCLPMRRHHRAQAQSQLMALLRHRLGREPCLNLAYKRTSLCVSQFESGLLSHLVAAFHALSGHAPNRAEEVRNCATSRRRFFLKSTERRKSLCDKGHFSHFFSGGQFWGHTLRGPDGLTSYRSSLWLVDSHLPLAARRASYCACARVLGVSLPLPFLSLLRNGQTQIKGHFSSRV